MSEGKRLDWNSEKIQKALVKAKAAWEAAPGGRKKYVLEKTFAKHAGVFRCYLSILNHLP